MLSKKKKKEEGFVFSFVFFLTARFFVRIFSTLFGN
jgi:hypothetical protein